MCHNKRVQLSAMFNQTTYLLLCEEDVCVSELKKSSKSRKFLLSYAEV